MFSSFYYKELKKGRAFFSKLCYDSGNVFTKTSLSVVEIEFEKVA